MEASFSEVWQGASETDREDVRSLWKSEGAIQDERVIDQRLRQLCVLARDVEGDLLGVTTAYRDFIERLDNPFYVMRMYVAERARRSRVGFELLHRVVEALEARNRSGTEEPAIGVYFELENPVIQRARPEAIWPTTGFVFIGKAAHGAHLRVRYFEGARIC